VEKLNTKTGRGQIRYQKQCFLYAISLHEFKPEKETSEFISIFNHTESNRRARYSYILVTEYVQNNAARDFLKHPQLKNYPHRAWTDIVPLDLYHPDEHLPRRSSFTFYFYCYYCKHGQEGISSTGHVYENPTDISNLQEVFPDVTSNLMGRKLKVTAPPAPPLVLISPSKSNPKENTIQGQQQHILEGMATKYNFTYSLFTSHQTGSKLPNGTWTGVMGEILYGRADIGLSVATAYDRNEIADFTSSVFYAFLVLVSTKPVPVFEWEAIFYPFKDTAWLALIGSMLVTFFLYQYFHNHALQYEVPFRQRWRSRFEMLAEIRRQLMTNFKTFYMTVGSMLEQGDTLKLINTVRTVLSIMIFIHSHLNPEDL
jgi:hypothetical protein